MVTVRAESLDLSLREVLFLLDRGVRAVQADHGLAIDGIVGPRTRAALDALLREPVGLPRGKGMFVRSIKHVGSIEAMLDRVAQTGLRWLAFQSIWQYADKKSSRWTGFTGHAKALRAAGHACWVWGFPWPGREAEFVEVLLASATSCGASGVLVDAEAPYLDAPEAAPRLMAALLPAARGRAGGGAHVVRRAVELPAVPVGGVHRGRLRGAADLRHRQQSGVRLSAAIDRRLPRARLLARDPGVPDVRQDGRTIDGAARSDRPAGRRGGMVGLVQQHAEAVHLESRERFRVGVIGRARRWRRGG
ncbi:peptidoglycan-binding protein [Nannocystis pusilla]|uniref:peptidoglycan-binding protein n=1 Tax=Nannocystis pusilla TaxID=889268 RepID=UPI003B8120B0